MGAGASAVTVDNVCSLPVPKTDDEKDACFELIQSVDIANFGGLKESKTYPVDIDRDYLKKAMDPDDRQKVQFHANIMKRHMKNYKPKSEREAAAAVAATATATAAEAEAEAAAIIAAKTAEIARLRAAGVHLPASLFREVTKIPRYVSRTPKAKSYGPEVYKNEYKDISKWKSRGGEKLEGPLESGEIALLDAEWLVNFVKRNVLKRRQELPDAAFVSLNELQVSSNFSDGSSLPIVVLSYPWLTPAHPDPNGHVLRIVTKLLTKLMGLEKTGDKGKEVWEHLKVGVLWDFASLHQDDRKTGKSMKPEERTLFKKGLTSLNLFYAHPLTYVLRMTDGSFPVGYPKGYDVPPPPRRYLDRGWCFAEFAMASLVKESTYSINLGGLVNDTDYGVGGADSKSRPPGLQLKLLDGTGHRNLSWPDLISECNLNNQSRGMVPRMPPMPPAKFRTVLASKTFTNGGDKDVVASIYEKGFNLELPEKTGLNYQWCFWKDDQASELASVIESGVLKKLETLTIHMQEFTEVGFKAISDAILKPGAVPALKWVSFTMMSQAVDSEAGRNASKWANAINEGIKKMRK